VEPLPHPPARCPHQHLAQRQAHRRSRRDGQLLQPQAPARAARPHRASDQTHGGEIRWRNVFLREVPADEANKILREKDGDGFSPIFNGKDFDGWAGPVQNYEAKDGALVCKPHKGGTIYTKEEYGDFVVRFELKLPPGGNNGLAIRYPGKGDTAYVGMCELQVLENTHPRWAKLNPMQFHGSAYGMVAAHRGFQRPVGEWNYQKVTVKGSTIQVELNGTIILDCDLAKVTKTRATSASPATATPSPSAPSRSSGWIDGGATETMDGRARLPPSRRALTQ